MNKYVKITFILFSLFIILLNFLDLVRNTRRLSHIYNNSNDLETMKYVAESSTQSVSELAGVNIIYAFFILIVLFTSQNSKNKKQT